MKSGIIFAIAISLFMVGGAFFSRFFNTSPAPSLITIEENLPSSETYYEEVFARFTNPTSTSRTGNEPLTGTDLIGRQLMMDYLSLASNGQATPANLQALADQYIASIPTLNNASRIGFQDLITVSDNEANLKTYSYRIGEIYSKYSTQMSGLSGGGIISDTLTASHYSYANQVGKIYENRALELKNVAVPLKLAHFHLQLINTNLSSAAALKSIAGTEEDPASGFAGILAMNQNLEEEVRVLKEIAKSLQ